MGDASFFRPTTADHRPPFFLVAASLLLYSFLAAPVPALNEPHYLTKARHYWQPEWCAGDVFLESADAHAVFFATVGWLTTVCSLTATAIIGRVLALTIVAWGWTALACALARSPAFSSTPGFCIPDAEARHPRQMPGCMSAWLFLALATCGNWSGEWLVGGVEGKVFAFGFLFWAWSLWIEARWYGSAAAMGAAVAFHPVVGMWGLLASIGAGCHWRQLWAASAPANPQTSDPEDTGGPKLPPAAPSTAQIVIVALIVVVVALPGLVPVLNLMLEPADAATRYAGSYIQVYYRLGHHLDPMQFPLRAHIGYGALAVVWLIGWTFGPRGPAWTLLHRLTAWSLVFALAGLAIGWGPRPPQEMPGFEWRMHLLKFYPFRLADLLLPFTVSLLAASWLSRVSGRVPQWTIVMLLVIGTLIAARVPLQDETKGHAQSAEWREVCDWTRNHTLPEALFVTPYGKWTFKWYAERPEFTNRKDCPQDVRGIVEWNRRQLLLTRWYEDRFHDGRYSRAELTELGRLTGAHYLIFEKAGLIDAAAVYQNATYRVYDLREATPNE